MTRFNDTHEYVVWSWVTRVYVIISELSSCTEFGPSIYFPTYPWIIIQHTEAHVTCPLLNNLLKACTIIRQSSQKLNFLNVIFLLPSLNLSPHIRQHICLCVIHLTITNLLALVNVYHHTTYLGTYRHPCCRSEHTGEYRCWLHPLES